MEFSIPLSIVLEPGYHSSLEHNSQVSRELMKLMKIPINFYGDILTVLKLEHYSPLLEYFHYSGRKALGLYILSNALEHQTTIANSEQVKRDFKNNVVKTDLSYV